MRYSYTIDLPTQSPAQNLRLGVKLPRSILLAPYLGTNPYFVDYTKTIDELWDWTIEARLESLKNLRVLYAPGPHAETLIAAGSVLQFHDWSGPDRATVVNQVNLLGLKLQSAGLADERSYRALHKFVGSYWYEKGRSSTVDFLNFCLGESLVIENLWSKDYVNFLPEGNSGIGAKITDTVPGPWFPTTHVRLRAVGAFNSINSQTLGRFFYEIANYNLVLESIAQLYTVNIIGNGVYPATVVNVGATTVNHLIADTCQDYGPYNHNWVSTLVSSPLTAVYFSASCHSTVGLWVGKTLNLEPFQIAIHAGINTGTGQPLTTAEITQSGCAC